jgi:hypothetical protein
MFGKMPPRKLKEIPVTVRMKVIEIYKTGKNKVEIGRLLGIPRTTIANIIEKKLKLMEVWKTGIGLGESRSLQCLMKPNFQES